MECIAKMQIRAIDSMMDAWEEEIKSPSSSSAILSKLKSLPNLATAGIWPDATAASQMTAFNPFGAYMQVAEQWQKVWTGAIAFWANTSEPNNSRARL